MAGNLQPLDQKFPITLPNGCPTDYFIRWAQQKQIDISEGITAAQAVQLIEDWAADREIIAGTALSGGGFLSADVTINHENSAVTPGSYTNSDLTVDAQGHITAVSNGSGGGGSGAETLIEERILGSASSTETFSSLPTTYRDLRIVLRSRGDTAAISTNVFFRCNGDTTAKYSYSIGSNGANSTTGTTQTSMWLIQLSAATTASGIASGGEVRIFDYNGTTFHKNFLGSNTVMTTTPFRTISAGWWHDTSAITSITLLLSAGNMVAGTIISLYGIL